MRLSAFLVRALGAAALGSTLLLSGCASIINGSTQKVAISSQPAGADVRIDGDRIGVTPTTPALSRKSSHRVELSHAGYKPYEVVLEPSFNGLTLMNLVAGGIIGLTVDGSTGATNTLHPDKVEAVLHK